MSREVRRVPVGWRHPVEHNPHWLYQRSIPISRSRPRSRLHAEDEMFTPLYGQSISAAQAEWDRGREQWEAGTHEHLAWLLKRYAADGYVDRDGKRTVTPYRVYAEDEETLVREFHPTEAAEIVAVYPYAWYAGERPSAENYMPDFDVPDDDLGWCLYSTVSEGTPVTPVFATAAELVEHLCTVGEDYDQKPYRRAAAEALVSSGASMATFIVTDGRVYDSAKDADLIEALPKDRP